MAQLIFDLGSGKSTHNDQYYVQQIIDAIKEADTGKHEVILKFQLFQDAPPNVPLDPLVFDAAYLYGREKGYKVTSSVFDLPSLKFLLNYDIPFVKIACRKDMYWLIGEVPRKVPLYVSYDGSAITSFFTEGVTWLFCIPEYPAAKEPYLMTRPSILSDHSEGLEVFKNLSPKIYEKHFVYEREADNPDAGLFALTVEDLKGIL